MLDLIGTIAPSADWGDVAVGLIAGIGLTERALESRRFGAYTLQAAMAAVHADGPSAASTDWRQIVLLYGRLLRCAFRQCLG